VGIDLGCWACLQSVAKKPKEAIQWQQIKTPPNHAEVLSEPAAKISLFPSFKGVGQCIFNALD
jgi:hypothetical protein